MNADDECTSLPKPLSSLLASDSLKCEAMSSDRIGVPFSTFTRRAQFFSLYPSLHFTDVFKTLAGRGEAVGSVHTVISSSGTERTYSSRCCCAAEGSMPFSAFVPRRLRLRSHSVAAWKSNPTIERRLREPLAAPGPEMSVFK